MIDVKVMKKAPQELKEAGVPDHEIAARGLEVYLFNLKEARAFLSRKRVTI